MKKTWMFLIAFSLIAIFAITFASAQYETVSSSIKTAMGSLVGILGGTIDALVAIPLKVLFFLVLFVVLTIATRRAFRNKTISILIALLVSAIGMQALPSNWLTAFLATYGTVAAVILIFLTVVVFWFFTRMYINTPLFTPMWITAGIVFLFLTMNFGFGVQEFSKPIYGGLAMIGAAISFVIVLNKGWLKKIRRHELQKDLLEKREELERVQHEIAHPAAGADLHSLQELRRDITADIAETNRELAGSL